MLGGVSGSRLISSLLFLLMLGAAVTGISSLAFPYTMQDSPSTAVVAATILEGGAPYKDAWDSRAPGVYFLYALKILIFGKGALGLRIFDLLWQCLTAFVIFRLARRAGGDARSGAMAALLYLILYFGQGVGSWAQPDGLLILPLAASVLLILRARESDRTWEWALAAALLGVVALIKLPFGLLGAGFLAMAMSQPFAMPVALRRASALAAGFAAPFAMLLVYFWAHGALRDLYYAQFVIAPAYVAKAGQPGYGLPLEYALRRRESTPIYLLLFGSLLTLWGKEFVTRLTRGAWLLWAWIAVALLVFFAHGSHYSYHLHPVVPPLAILAAGKFFEAWDAGASLWDWRRIAALLLLAWLSLSPVQWLRQNLWFARPALGKWETRSDWHDAARYLRENTAPGDRILALGGLAILYVDSDRAPACPIVPTRFFTLSTPEYDLRGICMQAILKQPPKLIALYTARPDPTGPTMGEMVLSEFPQLREYLREHYELDREIFASVIYKRKAVPAP